MKGMATFIKKLEWKGDARLYRLTPPLPIEEDETENAAQYVVVSAVVAPFSGPETYLFKADAEGNVTDWGELDGSGRGFLSHTKALNRAGYRVDAEVAS